MKKSIIILTAIALIAGGCNRATKKQSEETLQVSNNLKNADCQSDITRNKDRTVPMTSDIVSPVGMDNVTHTMPKNELKRLNTFLSNFPEAHTINFNVNTITSEDLIHFGIIHNWHNNNNRFVLLNNDDDDDELGYCGIDGKYISESIKKYFDIDFKEHCDVKGEDGYIYFRYDGKFYHCSLGDGEPTSMTRIKEVYRNDAGQLKITGEIGSTHEDEIEDEDVSATFEAYAKPYKYKGKDTWAIISFKSKKLHQ